MRVENVFYHDPYLMELMAKLTNITKGLLNGDRIIHQTLERITNSYEY